MNSLIKKFRSFSWFLMAVFAIWFSGTAFAQTLTVIRVDGISGSALPSGQGNNWGSSAYKYLPDAIARADFIVNQAPGNTVQIWVRGATGSGIKYRPDQSASNQSGTNQDGTVDIHDLLLVIQNWSTN